MKEIVSAHKEWFVAVALGLVVMIVWFVMASGEVSRTDVLVAASTIVYTILTGALFLSAYLANRPIVTLHLERN